MLENNQIKPVNPEAGTLALRILKICLILSGIGVFAAVMMGTSTVTVWQETANNQSFIKVAKEMRPNFEESLSLYTGNTQKIVDYLLASRPSTEEEFITFISKLEDLGQELSLNLDIKSTENTAVKSGKAVSKANSTISYQINFYGSIRDMKNFIRSLDDLPYYMEVSEIRYTNPAFTPSAEDTVGQRKLSSNPNISLVIKLFTKNQNAT